MSNLLSRLTQTLRPIGGYPDVVVGNLGSRFRFSYSCLGDTVNLAARLEGVVKETGLPLSVAESTIKAATMETDLTEVAEILVRGKSGHIKVFSDPHLV
jgi:adenylate cyclase